MQREAYGSRLGTSFNMSDPPTLSAHTSGMHRLAVTELIHDGTDFGFSAPIANEAAYLIGLQLRAQQRHDLWLDGRSVPVQPFMAGTTHFYDLERDPVAYMYEPFHPLFFYIPRAALAELADELDTAPVDDLRSLPGQSVDDPIIRHLGLSLLPALHAVRKNSPLFVDHVLLALRTHLVVTYGGVRCRDSIPRGGLAPWQQRQAMELMREHLVDGIPLALVAKACDLSCSAFVRAFKQSTGMSPHQWLIQRRIDQALELMRDRTLPLTEIALAAGFADQSHFTRMFTRKLGVSPGVWRNASGGHADASDHPVTIPA
ncbi:AraC family transcriptional regulator [Rhodanobacter sp. Soil772]|uniref:helix-turn-helix transcriptional regulator n=1 Tax=Rhodanobacter sp. Soil772 TaxID=1736406 RepID=UPI0006FD2D1B|nr:AraC family transcriptional regulator [Rhodanobacter sp. Soil772]KRE86018.1 AraC family transcriptional regulator [Rhodanobacter sp. Soil772]